MAVLLVYGNIPIRFLQCESGEWLLRAHSSETSQRELVRSFWTSSYHGHYTPIAFTAEFLFTKFANTNPWLWRARQLTATAVLGTLFFIVVRSIAISCRLVPRPATAVAAALTAAFLFQPSMRDLIAWPFHIFQLAWMAITLGAMASLVRLLKNPMRRWIWVSSGIGYASMQVLGIGFVTLCGTVAVLLVLTISAYAQNTPLRHLRRTLTCSLVILTFVGIAHGLCMYLLQGPPPQMLAPALPVTTSHALGLLVCYPVGVVLNFVGLLPNGFEGGSLTIRSAAPYGLLILLAGPVAFAVMWRAAVGQSNSQRFLPLGIHLFSFVSAVAYIAMFALRERYEIGGLDFDILRLFVGPRYVVPFGICLLGSFLLVFFRTLACLHDRWIIPLAIAFAAAALAANIYFRVMVTPRVLANNSISHARAWQLIVAMARECRSAGLSVPDLPVTNLITFSTEERLSHFEPVLHDALSIPPFEECHFASWDSIRQGRLAEYQKAAPSLRKVTKLLRLE